MRKHFLKVGVGKLSNWNQPADDEWQEYEDNDGQSQKPNPVRQRMRQLEKEAKELKEANAKLMAQVRQSAVKDTLKAKGFSEKAARLIPQDVEPTEEAIAKWLEDYADVLKPVESAPANSSTEEGGDEGGEGDDQASEYGLKYGRIAEATNAGRAATTKREDVARELASKDLTRERLVEMIQAAGGGIGMG